MDLAAKKVYINVCKLVKKHSFESTRCAIIRSVPFPRKLISSFNVILCGCKCKLDDVDAIGFIEVISEMLFNRILLGKDK